MATTTLGLIPPHPGSVMTRGVVLQKEEGDEERGTPDTGLYEMSIETAIMNHFRQKSIGRCAPPSPPPYTPGH